MNKKLNIEVLENIKTKNGLINKRVFKFTRKDGKDISYQFTKDIYQSILDTGIKSKDIYIQVMGHRELTLKSLGEDDLKDWDSDAYYENRVKDTKEFLNNFKYVRICVLESNSNKKSKK